jgi:nucleoside phosphorylase
MDACEAIVKPVPGRQWPPPGNAAVMAASSGDTAALRRRLIPADNDGFSFLLSRLYLAPEPSGRSALVGPLVGAPYAAMVLETLIAWGVRRVLFFGWCGTIVPGLRIGDILLPTAAYIDEGTSRHYAAEGLGPVHPAPALLEALRCGLTQCRHPWQEGPLWTTDGIFRETPEKVRAFQQRGALAVEMETSAVMAVGAFRKIETAAILVVSDRLDDDTWRPGFRDPRFRAGRKAVSGVLEHLCRTMP